MHSRAQHRGVNPGPVLVVDDDADARANLRDMLEELGQDVVEAGNGQQAFDFLLANPSVHVQLILLDLDMPHMTGWELLKLLKSYLRFATIPVVVVSRHVSYLRTRDHDMLDGCIEAPSELPKLRAVVEAFVLH
ncbi:MAG TPA: response regulator [Polyangiaceae bacterium]|nr:response regulator [Polyangiaceae bacterium]